MDRLASVLLHVNTLNANQTRDAFAHLNKDFTFAHNRMIQLADLIALRQVRIEIVLAVKS